MLDKLATIDSRYSELERLMADPEIAVDYSRVQELAREMASLKDVAALSRRYRKSTQDADDAREIARDESDREMAALAREELAELEDEKQALEDELRVALLPRDPNDAKNVIVEIRAGTGGEEAGLFAADMYRMYSRYAQLRSWKLEVINSNENGLGSIKEIVFRIDGKGAYSRLKHESGVHRVQRIPVTESAGRIHTSAATVAVLPEAEEVDVEVDPEDLQIDIFHSSGHGGQNVQKVATAVRITHIPTGVVAVCQDERSQYKNKREGHVRPPLAPAGHGDSQAAGGGERGQEVAGRFRRPLRARSHLQLPAGPRHRPPGLPHEAQPSRHPRRRHRPVRRCLDRPRTGPDAPGRRAVNLRACWIAAAERLDDAVEDSRLEAEVLLRHVLGWDRARFFASLRDPVDDGAASSMDALLRRRTGGEPLAYIVGRREFYGLDFHVDPRVLVPRPETEMLVDAVIEYAGRRRGNGSISICDVGTGSGAIAVALAVHVPRDTVYATDSSPGALEVAARNAARHGVSDRVRLVGCDLMHGLPGPVDVIISNPPYVRSADIPRLQREVQWEPMSALDGGPGGMAIMHRLFHHAPSYLRPGGFMAVEIDPRQRNAALGMAKAAFDGASVTCADDLAGSPRAIVLEAPPGAVNERRTADSALQGSR